MARRGGKLQALAIILVGLAVVVGIVAWQASKDFEDKTLELLMGENNCYRSPSSPAHTVFLIDQTDPFTRGDRQWVDALLEAEASRLPQYGKLSIYSLSLEPFANKPIEPVVCSPGPIADRDPMETGRQVLGRYSTFLQSIRTQGDGAVVQPTANQSPIMEAVSAIAKDVDFTVHVRVRRLVIISDLLEFRGTLRGPRDFYHRVPQYQEIEDIAAPTVNEASLADVCVSIRLVERPEEQVDSDRLIQFWEAYFLARGAAVHWIQSPTEDLCAGVSSPPQ